MARPVHWRDLTIGAVAIAGIALLAMLIVLFAEIGGIRGRKAQLHVLAASARGVLEGTEVMVGGKRAGTVQGIEFLPPDFDTTATIVLRVTVLESALPLLRSDSRAQIRPTGTIIGAPMVDLLPGSAEMPALRPGDTLRADPQIAAETVVERIGGVGGAFTGLMDDWRVVGRDVRSIGRTFREMQLEAPRGVAVVRQRTARLATWFAAGTGTLALESREGEVQRRLGRVLTALDTIGTLLASEESSLGRFRRDRTLAADLQQTGAELAAVRAALHAGDGSAGRLQHDRALKGELDALQRELDALSDDVQRNPFRYLIF